MDECKPLPQRLPLAADGEAEAADDGVAEDGLARPALRRARQKMGFRV